MSTDGYGKITILKKTLPAHRVSWTMYVGAIPDGQQVLHKCDIRQCVRPDHLFLGTNMDNQQDLRTKGGRVEGFQVKGERSLKSKLTTAQVLEIRRDYTPGSGELLAEKYGVRGQSINDIIHRKSWKHI